MTAQTTVRYASKIDVAPASWDHVFSPSSALALITTVDASGRVNAAPFGSCIRVCHEPVQIAITVNTGDVGNPNRSEGQFWTHDTFDNVLATGEFVVNLVPFEQSVIEKVFVCGLPFKSGINELEKSGLTALASKSVRAPRVAECHAHFECKLEWTKAWAHRMMILGRVVNVSVDEGCLDERGWPYLDRIKPTHFCQGKMVPAYQVTSVPWQYTGSRDDLVGGYKGPLSGPSGGPSDSTTTARPAL
jgi:flavin reductase (DIM6/NTAB) family NADH-FMN oxidoreductase RutF